MDRELVSVLMVNYNRGTTIGESIKSVLAQTYTDLELIIVDDGSTDDSCSVIESIKVRESSCIVWSRMSISVMRQIMDFKR